MVRHLESQRGERKHIQFWCMLLDVITKWWIGRRPHHHYLINCIHICCIILIFLHAVTRRTWLKPKEACFVIAAPDDSETEIKYACSLFCCCSWPLLMVCPNSAVTHVTRVRLGRVRTCQCQQHRQINTGWVCHWSCPQIGSPVKCSFNMFVCGVGKRHGAWE